MNTKPLTERLYKELEKLTRDTPFTMTGWLLIITLLAVPLLLGCSYIGYTVNSQLIELQSRTNGMEYTDNWHVLHHEKHEEGYFEKASRQKAR